MILCGTGSQDLRCIPEGTLPFSFYPKMGYGEVSEHTVDQALAVLRGDEPMPAKPPAIGRKYETSVGPRYRTGRT